MLPVFSAGDLFPRSLKGPDARPKLFGLLLLRQKPTPVSPVPSTFSWALPDLSCSKNSCERGAPRTLSGPYLCLEK